MMDDLRNSGVRGRFVPAENLHITLCFIGESSVDDMYVIEDCIDSVPFPETHIEIGECGNFGDLFWVGIKQNPELDAYVKKLRRKLSDEGIPFDKKKFRPHITLVRRAEFPAGLTVKAPGASMTADHASLMLSERADGRMVYTELYGSR